MRKSNFIHYNPNPEFKNEKTRWNRGDCVIRAICKATGLSWEKAFITMCKAALEVHDMPNCRLGETAGLKKLGFVKGESLKPNRGEHWPTVDEMAKRYSDKIILCNCVGHIVCCMNGHYYDTWDCGGYTTRSYWVLNK
jgi:hypothetical protein